MKYVRTAIRAVLIILLVVIVCALVSALYVRESMLPYQYVLLDNMPHTDVALVLGASVAAGKPSPILAARADTAIELYQKGKVSKILVTGDNSALSHDEVTPVRKYLVKAGIPAEDIFLDHAGFDTYSSMYRARDIFGATSATIITQDFHLSRSLFIARRLGIDAYGAIAMNYGASSYDYLREIPASVKAIWDLIISRTPKYLGTIIPLSGDGRETW
jgi:SanA protein